MEIVFPEDLSQTRVTVVGDVMLDRYWSGATERLSPEAPVPVVNVQDVEDRCGGAANVALNIAALSAQVECIGLIGEDEHGAQLANLLATHNIAHQLMRTKKSTTTKLRVIGEQQQLVRLDFENLFSAADSSSLQSALTHSLRHADAMVVSDYAKGALHHVDQFITLARNQNIPIIVDPKGKDYKRYHGATILTPNLKEFEMIVGSCVNDAARIERAYQLITQLDLEAILVTLGAEGMLLVHANAPALTIPAHSHEVFDVTGAGDTVVAVLAAALGAGLSLDEAVPLANVAAGMVVTKFGSACVTEAELRRECQQQQNDLLGIVTAQQCQQAVADARSHGEKIVMTNGCFDLLHVGHLQYLKQARALGDRLVVAVNDDASIQQLKGPSRPINQLQDRLELLAGLRCVDWVVPFSSLTPKDIIAEISPDILVKGDDYELSEIVGAESVLANGGEVKTLPFRQGYSTTEMVARISAREESIV